MKAGAHPDRVVDHLLDTLLDLSQPERQRRLDELRRHQPELAARLTRLLAYADTDSPALRPGGGLAGELAQSLLGEAQAPAREPGEAFCGYRIEALIGRGGMSEVYRATRDYGEFRATVALKVLHHQGQRNPALRDYLRHEQRALSRLDHPGIARFIDAGEGPEGEIYLAMEYVEGEPIADHADRHALPLKARVDLLIALCRALEHAHARRLVHGDVKSTNVLVDHEGRLRLVDFGIASEAGPVLAGSVRAFTPECAAPEQRRGDHITTGTDVFQVGALAWRLLTGRSRLQEEPAMAPTPSAVARSGEDHAVRAAARGLRSSGALARALRGDLDAIVGRCLAHDPEARYLTCSALREDLEHWRRGRPVTARPAGIGLRLVKFIRRNARALAIVALLTVLALAATGSILLSLRAEQRARLAEADRALRVEQFLAELFRSTSPYLNQDGRDPLATFTALGERLLGETPDLDRRTRARLGLSLAQLRLAAGDHEGAGTLVRQARAGLADEADGGGRLGADLDDALARIQVLAGAPAAAAQTQAGVVAWLASAEAPALDQALAQTRLADYRRRSGDLAQARSDFQAAMPVVLARHADAPLEAVAAIDRHVRFLSAAGDMATLTDLAPRFEAVFAALPAGGLAEAQTQVTRAEIDALLVGPEASAERLLTAAERFEALLGPGHPRVGNALSNACAGNLESGRMVLAEQQCQRALTIFFQANGPESEGVAFTSSNLAAIAYNTGRLREADAHVQRALRLAEQLELPNLTLFALSAQGRHARVRGLDEQALERFGRADALRLRLFPDNDALRVDLLQEQATALVGLGRLGEARPILDRLLTGSHALPANRARERVWLQTSRLRLAAASNDPGDLAVAIQSTWQEYQDTPGRNALEQGWLASELGQAALATGNRSQALALFEQALAGLPANEAGAHWAIAWAGHRQAGGAADPTLDAQARALIEDEGIVTALARDYLRN